MLCGLTRVQEQRQGGWGVGGWLELLLCTAAVGWPTANRIVCKTAFARCCSHWTYTCVLVAEHACAAGPPLSRMHLKAACHRSHSPAPTTEPSTTCTHLELLCGLKGLISTLCFLFVGGCQLLLQLRRPGLQRSILQGSMHRFPDARRSKPARGGKLFPATRPPSVTSSSHTAPVPALLHRQV